MRMTKSMRKRKRKIEKHGKKRAIKVNQGYTWGEFLLCVGVAGD